MALSAAQLQSISKQVYQKFPELQGAQPVVQGRGSGAKAAVGGDQYLIVFKGAERQRGIQRIVRVTADAKGRIVKISTSR